MDDRVKAILARLRDSPEFSEQADFSDVNVCAIDGDNALQWLARSGDRSGAKSLIKPGIDVNKSGDLGYTLLHVGCIRGTWRWSVYSSRAGQLICKERR